MATVRQKLIEKYRPVLTAMAEHGEDGDMNVLFDKLVSMANENGNGDTYYVPEDFDYEELRKDTKGLE